MRESPSGVSTAHEIVLSDNIVKLSMLVHYRCIDQNILIEHDYWTPP